MIIIIATVGGGIIAFLRHRKATARVTLAWD
jgi:hypothetical protein